MSRHLTYSSVTIQSSDISLPSTGSCRVAVRPLRRYYQDAMTSCCSSRVASFPSLDDTTVVCVVLNADDPHTGRGLELITRCLRPGLNVETTGSPKFLGNPNDPFAHALRLRQDVCSRPFDAFAPIRNNRMAPDRGNTKALARKTFEAQSHGFRTRCLRFAVTVARRHARLASGGWSGPTGRAFNPQGHNRRFQISQHVNHPPPPSFLAQSPFLRWAGQGWRWPRLAGRCNRLVVYFPISLMVFMSHNLTVLL